MPASFPFLTSYDPPGTSEGTLDPLGLYQIADQLAVQLVPGVRERMQRIRFLTAMAVGAVVTEDIDDDPQHRDASPYLVWEWLVVEALIRQMAEDPQIWGVPGTLVAKRAIPQHGYLDARSYLKTPRIFGFHGVYKRLAIHLGIVDVHLRPGPNTHALVDAWARGFPAGATDAKWLIARWTQAVARSIAERPPRTKPGWGTEGWEELARAFAPVASRAREKRYLHDALHARADRPLGALPDIWELQSRFDDEEFSEEGLHEALEKRRPDYRPLLLAIRSYEAFARRLQDAFDILKAEAARTDGQGFVVPEIARDEEFRRTVSDLHDRCAEARQALGELGIGTLAVHGLFSERFDLFLEPMSAGDCAIALCDHHAKVQRAKSSDGKRPWFDPLGKNRIYVRHNFREERRATLPGRYVHEYRGTPIRRFRADLT